MTLRPPSSRAARQNEYEHRRRTNIVPRIDQDEARQRFSAIVLSFPAKHLALASGASVDAAKQWKAGQRFPHGAALINLARAIPAINDWLAAETRPSVSMQDPNALHAAMTMLAAAPGREGDAARAYLRAWREE